MKSKHLIAIVYFFLFHHANMYGQDSIKTKSQPVTVSGTIKDYDSNPIGNASVYLLNTDHNTVSDKQGTYTFTNIPSGIYTIQVSAMGYASITKQVNLNTDNHLNLNIQLATSIKELGDVVVSGQKTEGTTRNVPINITSLSAKQINEFRIWDSKDITAMVPNMYAADPGDNRNVVSLRGITSTSYDPAIVTYIDGVSQFSLDTYISQLFDVEKIEVLKGGQGTLYGRNAMGGVINIVTKQPTNRMSGYAEVSIGNHNQQRYSAGFRMPIIKNKLFIGIAGVYDSRDGYYRNGFNHSTFDKQFSGTGNYYLKFIAQSKWSITLNVKNHHVRNNGAFPLTIVNDPKEALETGFTLNQNAVTKMIDNTYNASLSVNHYGTRFNFVSQTAYQYNHRYYSKPIDSDFSPIDGISINNNYPHFNKVHIVTQEMRFSSASVSSSPFTWMVGNFSFYQSNPVKQATLFGTDAAMLGAQPNSSVIITSKNQNYGTAIYGQLTYTLKKKVDFIVGLRFDYEGKNYLVRGEYRDEANPTDTYVIQPDTAASASFISILPKAAILYRLSEQSSIFVSYNRGFKAGGLTQLSTNPSNPPLHPYKPEFSDNIELGSKNNFLSNRLHLNISCFASFINNAQVPTLVLPDAITIIKNAGKLRNIGVELEAIALPVKGLELMCNLGYTNSAYTNLRLPQNDTVMNYTGNKQVFTPEFTSMLSAQYSYNFHTQHELKLVTRFEWKCIGKQYFDLANTIGQDPFHLLSVRGGVSAKNYEIMFWAKNLLNTKYISYAYDFGAVHLGNPMVYGATLTGRF